MEPFGENARFKGRRVVAHHTLNEKGEAIFKSNAITTTKYTVLTFLPKNLFEQFSRIANLYFLVVAIILYVYPWSPLEGSSAILPLIIVVGISAVREAIEDFLRYLSDKQINNSVASRLKDEIWENVIWRDILVGDIIFIKKDEQIPADVFLLNTSEPEGVAYIDTCNLDGETNLKARQSLQGTSFVIDARTASTFNGSVICDEPNNFLYTFNGCLYLESQNRQHFESAAQTDGYNTSNELPIENKQILLRGSCLKNTRWAIGLVIYTGVETKVMMNSSAARTKHSSIERKLNLKLISVFAFMLILAIVAASLGMVQSDYENREWYLYGAQKYTRAQTFFIRLVAYLILINAMIPISLYVTLEVVRVFQAMFVGWDKEMYHMESRTGAKTRTTNLSEDLGLVRYVFSDKTGTLTKNEMEFMKCSIAGRVYGKGITEVAYAACQRRGIPCERPATNAKAFQDDALFRLLENNTPQEIDYFMWMLATCNSVLPEEDPTKEHGIAFQASSPDEGALVSAAADFDYIFTQRGPDYVLVRHAGQDVRVDILANIEFTSERKRSSVIIRHPFSGKIILFTKGADDLIFTRLATGSENSYGRGSEQIAEKGPGKRSHGKSADSDQDAIVEATKLHLKSFATDGLRTLCVAYRELDEGLYMDWSQRYHEACCSIEDREERVNRASNEIECEMKLLGATAIEDKLQEGVPDAIDALMLAGVNIWIITGDKRETAINIGFACSLLSADMTLIVLDSEQPSEVCRAIAEGLALPDEKVALIVSGTALTTALESHNSGAFFELAKRCQSVICCRVSPLQKATIVELVREKTKEVCLAIGDGANDVGMILKADIGVGISGQEGRQAVLASDYSFSQFRFLKRLLLYHGRLSLKRNIDMINYSFYKNMVYTLNQFLYGFFCKFSSFSLYDSYLYSVFNVLFTSAPPVVYAGIERDVSRKHLNELPELYQFDGQKHWMISYGNFWVTLLLGIVHGLVAFFIPLLGFEWVIDGKGHELGQGGLDITVYGCVVMIVNFRIASMTTYWTWMSHVFVWGSMALYPLVVLFLDHTGISPSLSGLSSPTLSSAGFWFSLAGASLLANVFVIAIGTITNSRDKMTNRVMLEERTKHRLESLRTKEQEEEITKESCRPGESGSLFTSRIGQTKEQDVTGYAFDAPISSFQTFRAKIQPSNFNTTNSILSRLRPKTVSNFGLDQL